MDGMGQGAYEAGPYPVNEGVPDDYHHHHPPLSHPSPPHPHRSPPATFPGWQEEKIGTPPRAMGNTKPPPHSGDAVPFPIRFLDSSSSSVACLPHAPPRSPPVERVCPPHPTMVISTSIALPLLLCSSILVHRLPRYIATPRLFVRELSANLHAPLAPEGVGLRPAAGVARHDRGTLDGRLHLLRPHVVTSTPPSNTPNA